MAETVEKDDVTAYCIEMLDQIATMLGESGDERLASELQSLLSSYMKTSNGETG